MEKGSRWYTTPWPFTT